MKMSRNEWPEMNTGYSVQLQLQLPRRLAGNSQGPCGAGSAMEAIKNSNQLIVPASSRLMMDSLENDAINTDSDGDGSSQRE